MDDIMERLQEVATATRDQIPGLPKLGELGLKLVVYKEARAALYDEAADTIDRQREEIERLRAAVIKLCDEFEDATYDTNSGGQSADRKNLIAECRRAALEEDGRT